MELIKIYHSFNHTHKHTHTPFTNMAYFAVGSRHEQVYHHRPSLVPKERKQAAGNLLLLEREKGHTSRPFGARQWKVLVCNDPTHIGPRPQVPISTKVLDKSEL